ncbi:MAG: glycine cleavage system protein GcvH [Veillonellaceae bacterium]|jgi:glycine cleavage system H protein|nr:glycine cleavage system protein GcvH [Veillonellaceae bacterium]
MQFPTNLKYSKEHEWVRLEGQKAVVGITDFAQSQLGDVVFVELPAVGASVVSGKRFSVVESVKAVSDIFAPVNGMVVEVNEMLNDAPEKVNQDPYGEGWIAVIELASAADLAELMDSTAYAAQVAKGGH